MVSWSSRLKSCLIISVFLSIGGWFAFSWLTNIHKNFLLPSFLYPANYETTRATTRAWISDSHGFDTFQNSTTPGFTQASSRIDEILHWTPDWENQTAIGQVLESRRRRILRQCRAASLKHSTRNYLLVDRGGKVGILHSIARSNPTLKYCQMAKTGSTFLTAALHAVTRNHKKNLNSKGRKVDFTTIRNPWHRLVSVYLEKFRGVTRKFGFCMHSVKKIASFEQFVHECVLPQWRQKRINIHWQPAVDRCEICKDKFDYLVTTENMMNEFSYILEHENILDNAKRLLDNVRSATIRAVESEGVSKSYQDYYKSVEPEDIAQLRELYEDDIRILGYPESPFVDSPYA